MRLINADKATKILHEILDPIADKKLIWLAWDVILEDCDTIDAEPIKHGHWIFEEYPDGYYHSQCSLCNSWFVGDAFLNPYNYCPNCGAKMDEEEL